MHYALLFTAKYLFIFVALIAGIYWLKQPRKEKIRLVVFGIIAGMVSFALVKIGGAIYYDPRPFVSHHIEPLYFHAADNGFPSDHTVLTAYIAMVVYSSSKRLGLVLLAMSLLIGCSRVMGYIHSPIDIAGSILFALIGGIAAYYLTPKVMAKLKT